MELSYCILFPVPISVQCCNCLMKEYDFEVYFKLLFKVSEPCSCFVFLFLYMADFAPVLGHDFSLLVNKLWNLFAFLLNEGEATETAMFLWGQKLLGMLLL